MRAANDLKEVVSEYVSVNAANMVVCPFHPDIQPSLALNLPRQIFHCFGCKTAGDVFRFVELMDGSTFRVAMDKLAQRVAIPPYRAHPREQEAVELGRQIEIITDWTATYYQSRLTDEVREYVVVKRGLPEEFIERFRIGWADGTVSTYIASSVGPDWLPILVRAGLALARGNQTGWVQGNVLPRDYFHDRIILPCLARGLAVYLSGRLLGEGDPKYLHQKGREAPLYNEEALSPGRLFVTEGQISALSLVAWEYPTVGLLGGSRPSGLGQLRRVREPYAVLDADRSGREAALKLALALGPGLKIVGLPDRLDPNDFYRTRTKTEFDDLVGAALDPVKFAVESIPVDLDRTRLSAALEPALRFIATLMPLQQETYLRDYIRPRFKLGAEHMKAINEDIEVYKSAATRKCPACGTMLQWRR